MEARHPTERRWAAPPAGPHRCRRNCRRGRGFRVAAGAGSRGGRKTLWSQHPTGGTARPGQDLAGPPRVAPWSTPQPPTRWVVRADPTAELRRIAMLDWAHPGCGPATAGVGAALRIGRERPRIPHRSPVVGASPAPPVVPAALRRARRCRGDRPRSEGSPAAQGEGRGQSQSDPISVYVVYRH